jgi:hypothetical protein
MPDPDPARLAYSEALARRIAARIVRDGGWIPFDAWMAHALYEPGLGYYSGPARPFGAAGDFVTAPELSPLFARCVARQVGQWFGHCAPTVLEFGAGSGRLAADLLMALHAQGTPAEVYAIVELSARRGGRAPVPPPAPRAAPAARGPLAGRAADVDRRRGDRQRGPGRHAGEALGARGGHAPRAGRRV